MTSVNVTWVRNLPGSFEGSGVAVVPDGVVLKLLLNGTAGVVGLDRNGSVRWQLSPTSFFWADGERLWFGGRQLRLVQASNGIILAERDLSTGVVVLAPGVAMIGGVAQGRLMGFDAGLGTLWEWTERPSVWSAIPNYLWCLDESHSCLVSLPGLERKKVRLSIPAGGSYTSFEHEGVMAHVAVADGESCGVSWRQGTEVWRRMVEPRGLAVKWDDSFIFSGAQLHRIEIATGKTVWARPLEPLGCVARVFGDEICFATASGRIQVVDCRTGETTFDGSLPAVDGEPQVPHAVLPCGPDKLFLVMYTELHCIART